MKHYEIYLLSKYPKAKVNAFIGRKRKELENKIVCAKKIYNNKEILTIEKKIDDEYSDRQKRKFIACCDCPVKKFIGCSGGIFAYYPDGGQYNVDCFERIMFTRAVLSDICCFNTMDIE